MASSLDEKWQMSVWKYAKYVELHNWYMKIQCFLNKYCRLVACTYDTLNIFSDTAGVNNINCV